MEKNGRIKAYSYTKSMSWEDIVEDHFNYRDDNFNNIPFGFFCYEDITPTIRLYCKHIRNNKCSLFVKPIDEDFIKCCNINVRWGNNE